MNKNASLLRELAEKYNDPQYFQEDPIIFPKHFAALYAEGKASLKDVETAAVIASHLAWGRRCMIVRDCNRAFDEMKWRPYDYLMAGDYRNDGTSLHRTVMWSEFAGICTALNRYYSGHDSLEGMPVERMRTEIFGRKADPKAANKKINMMKRWMVRRDGIVDLGLWKDSSPSDLIIPLDVHVHTVALEMELTTRRGADAATAAEITSGLGEIFPGDPCKGDFALFGYGITRK